MADFVYLACCWYLGLFDFVEAICKKVGAGIGTLKRIKPFVPAQMLQPIYSALIQPYFDYCSPLWDTCNKTLKDKLQKYQNRGARIIAGASYKIRSADVLQALEWEDLESRRIITKATLMYKILNDYSAPNLKKLLKRRNSIQTFYDLRNSQNNLDLPKPRREFLKKSFKYSGSRLWNNLSPEAKEAISKNRNDVFTSRVTYRYRVNGVLDYSCFHWLIFAMAKHFTEKLTPDRYFPQDQDARFTPHD